jgi:hypothetical protein
MASVTLSIDETLKERLKRFIWVNWSEIAKEETIKKIIFEKYIKTGNVSKDDWTFCEKIDWHPVDELPLKEEFIEKLNEIKKGKYKRYNSVEEFFEKIK